jgi:hypothetical protein
MLLIVDLRHLSRNQTKLSSDERESFSLESSHDLSRETSLNSIWLYDDKGTVHEGKT